MQFNPKPSSISPFCLCFRNSIVILWELVVSPISLVVYSPSQVVICSVDDLKITAIMFGTMSMFMVIGRRLGFWVVFRRIVLGLVVWNRVRLVRGLCLLLFPTLAARDAFLVFFLLWQREPPLAIDLSPDVFYDDFVSVRYGLMGSSFFLSATSSVFLLLVWLTALTRPCACFKRMCDFSFRVFMNDSE